MQRHKVRLLVFALIFCIVLVVYAMIGSSGTPTASYQNKHNTMKIRKIRLFFRHYANFFPFSGWKFKIITTVITYQVIQLI